MATLSKRQPMRYERSTCSTSTPHLHARALKLNSPTLVCLTTWPDRLLTDWVAAGDFLLLDHSVGSADFVVGNPPYIRLENVPPALTDAYRRNCPTMRGRSDIYVGFFEIGLELLKPGGALAFICADRWMHNQYGAALRELVTSEYAVDTIVTMHDVPAFEDEVSAYPAIAMLRNRQARPGERRRGVEGLRRVDARADLRLGAIDRAAARRLRPHSRRAALRSWFDGGELWPSGSPAQLALLADLERRFPPLENPTTGTRVGIGVATGCDDVYITRRTDLVEERSPPSVAEGRRHRDWHAGLVGRATS